MPMLHAESNVGICRQASRHKSISLFQESHFSETSWYCGRHLLRLRWVLHKRFFATLPSVPRTIYHQRQLAAHTAPHHAIGSAPLPTLGGHPFLPCHGTAPSSRQIPQQAFRSIQDPVQRASSQKCKRFCGAFSHARKWGNCAVPQWHVHVLSRLKEMESCCPKRSAPHRLCGKTFQTCLRGGEGKTEGSCACSLTNLVKPPLRREDGDQPIVPRRAVPRHF